MFLLTGVEYRYRDELALSVPSWRTARGEPWLVAGASGSGKTTLLNLLAGMLRTSAGSVVGGGHNLQELDGAALDRWRGRQIGYVPQRLHLVASLSVQDNLLLAQYLAGMPVDGAVAGALLSALEIGTLASRLPHQLSPRQAQRVAVARAVINRPGLVLADEPTAALDDRHAQQTVNLLTAQADAVGATLVVASHDARIRAAFAHHLMLGATQE